jgi:hypothetical protein
MIFLATDSLIKTKRKISQRGKREKKEIHRAKKIPTVLLVGTSSDFY